jgi:hypothetical protein
VQNNAFQVNRLKQIVHGIFIIFADSINRAKFLRRSVKGYTHFYDRLDFHASILKSKVVNALRAALRLMITQDECYWSASTDLPVLYTL